MSYQILNDLKQQEFYPNWYLYKTADWFNTFYSMILSVKLTNYGFTAKIVMSTRIQVKCKHKKGF